MQYNNTVWAITSFYRFFPSNKREENFYKFRDNLWRQGIKLAVIEITTEESGDYFLKTGDCDLLVQLKTHSVLWHKERSLNLLVKQLPLDCKYVAWFDADCILLDDTWPEQAMTVLKKHNSVQLCSSVQFLKEDGSIDFERRSYIYNSLIPNSPITMGGRPEGAPGFCWMMRRDLLQHIQLYDKAIIGGGDVLFANMVLHANIAKVMLSNGEPGSTRFKDYTSWALRARDVLNRNLERTTYLDIPSQHLWHDDRKYRIYGARHFLLLLEDFNPKTDLVIEPKTGLYQLVNDRIKQLVWAYFYFREQEKTPEHDRLFDVYELLMLTLKDVGQERRRLMKKEKQLAKYSLQMAARTPKRNPKVIPPK